HLADAARLVRLAAEGAPAGSVLHGVAEEGVPLRVVAEEIGRHLGLPVAQVPAAHFGRLGGELAVDAPASSVLTQQLLGWRPTRPGLLADLGRWSTDLAAAR
ncbi:3-beta hydroxysteroid dehydrogenase, partial [Modestobacter versicolor]